MIPVNFETFNFTISPSQPSNCVLHYNITPVFINNGSVLDDISVDPPSSDDIISINGFDSCRNSYGFSVVAVTLNGTGEKSNVFPAQPSSKLQ